MKSVLVTGGTIRLGKIIADKLRAEGWRILTASHRPDSGADIIVDFSDPMGAARCYAEALKLLNGLPPDALVNNAALFSGPDHLLNAVNFIAPQKLTMLMAGRENGRGAVVNILDAQSRETAYGRTKRELGEWTLKASALFVDTLNVNAVAPGSVLASPSVHEPAVISPMGRPTPDAVASAVSFLLSAPYTTGQIISVG